MKRLTIIGLLVLIFGISIYLIFINEVSGVARATIIGLMIGSGVALRGQLDKN